MVKKVGINVQERDGILLEHEELAQKDDFLYAGGISFEGNDDYLLEKIGGVIKDRWPNYSVIPTLTNDEITSVEYYNSFVQVTANRILRGDFTYVSDNLTQENWKVYDLSDGTTVLRTIILTHTYSGDDLTKTEVSES